MISAATQIASLRSGCHEGTNGTVDIARNVVIQKANLFTENLSCLGYRGGRG